MSNGKKGGTGRPASVPPDLKKERDDVLQSLSKGLADDFAQHQDRMLARLRDLEAENADLRAQVQAADAARELLAKIERLESEKRELLSRYHEVEAESTQFGERFREVETQFADLANLFVASNQLHSSLSPRSVTRRLKEVLAQLVGAERYAIYLANPERTELVPIASEGVPGGDVTTLHAGSGPIGAVLHTGEASVDEDADTSAGTVGAPAAILPLRVDDRVVGVIAIFGTLTQKNRFSNIDFELFKLLSQHAATALVGASLFARAEQKLPGLEAFLDLSV